MEFEHYELLFIKPAIFYLSCMYLIFIVFNVVPLSPGKTHLQLKLIMMMMMMMMMTIIIIKINEFE
jgi:hypothetical protein